jgi:hypothetical protein
VRVIDILGTTAFSLLPLVPMNLVLLLPGMKKLLAAVTPPLEIERVMSITQTPLFIPMTLALLAAIVLMLIWLFGAVKVSCNLKGWRLWTVYLVGILGGDILCRLAIGALY